MKAPVLIIVQARLGSTRLPGKVLHDLGGKPMLLRMLERLSRVKTATNSVVATTTEAQDDRIEALCKEAGIAVFRGDPTDLLDRHYQAALAIGAETVAKIPSDCPLIDPAVVDAALTRFAAGDCDYVSNLHPASWPDGNDVEVMSRAVLETAWHEARLPMEREHTTPFIWERPDRFRLANVVWQDAVPDGTRDCSMTHRWTVDYPEDYAAVRAIFEALHGGNPVFGVDEILAFLSQMPEVAALNACHRGVNWYRHHLHQLRTVDARSTRADGIAQSWHEISAAI